MNRLYHTIDDIMKHQLSGDFDQAAGNATKAVLQALLNNLPVADTASDRADFLRGMESYRNQVKQLLEDAKHNR